MTAHPLLIRLRRTHIEEWLRTSFHQYKRRFPTDTSTVAFYANGVGHFKVVSCGPPTHLEKVEYLGDNLDEAIKAYNTYGVDHDF